MGTLRVSSQAYLRPNAWREHRAIHQGQTVKKTIDEPLAPARIESLKVQNFRALREVEFKELTPLTVLLGPNGSGKSTVFDVFCLFVRMLRARIAPGMGQARARQRVEDTRQ